MQHEILLRDMKLFLWKSAKQTSGIKLQSNLVPQKLIENIFTI